MSRKVELWSGGTTYQVENAALDEIEMVNTWRSHPWKDDQERGLVTQLVLDNNKLCVLPKECIDWFPGLKYLWLQRNRIEIWPEAITRLVSLEQLYLTHNNLAWVSPTVTRLTRLYSLSLVGNAHLPKRMRRRMDAQKDACQQWMMSISNYYGACLSRCKSAVVVLLGLWRRRRNAPAVLQMTQRDIVLIMARMVFETRFSPRIWIQKDSLPKKEISLCDGDVDDE